MYDKNPWPCDVTGPTRESLSSPIQTGGRAIQFVNGRKFRTEDSLVVPIDGFAGPRRGERHTFVLHHNDDHLSAQ